jgi:signal transduction histidine kinase
MCVANYSTAAYGSRWRPAALALVVGTEAVLFARIAEERLPGEVLFALFVAVGTWLVGDVVRTRLTRADRAVGEARELLAEREAAAARALAEERARIARELHDVIAHSVSVMGVQAGAARTLIDVDPDAARDALRSIETTARDSVAELQRLLEVLRDRDDTDGRAPQPGLGELSRLVGQVRSAGLPVELTVTGTGALPPGVDLAAYRIVQEALTNALKHAGAPTAVTVSRTDGELRIEVRDRGAGRGGRGNPGGHGLVGMRERAQLYGGTLEAHPAPGGGFVVRAVLPVPADAA